MTLNRTTHQFNHQQKNNYYMRFTRNIKETINNLKNTFLNTIIFHGRSTRSEYWDFEVFYTLLTSLSVLLEHELSGHRIILSNSGLIYSNGTISLLTFIILTIPRITLAIRRFHDLDKDWYYIIPLRNL